VPALASLILAPFFVERPMQIASGTVASFHYTLRAEDGAEIRTRAGERSSTCTGTATSCRRSRATRGRAGDTLSVTLEPEQAYGVAAPTRSSGYR
jgi:FKBP-type peptidyl-prolyl cis-trans isomerase 2